MLAGLSFRFCCCDRGLGGCAELRALNRLQEAFSLSMTSTAQQAPVLTLGDKQYAMDALPEEAKKAVAGLQVAESQIRMAQDQLKVLAVGRQTLMAQLQASLDGVEPISAE